MAGDAYASFIVISWDQNKWNLHLKEEEGLLNEKKRKKGRQSYHSELIWRYSFGNGSEKFSLILL